MGRGGRTWGRPEVMPGSRGRFQRQGFASVAVLSHFFKQEARLQSPTARAHSVRALATRAELWPPELTWKVKSVLLLTLCPLARISTSADQAPVATVCPSPFPPVIPMVSKLVGISFFNVFSCFYTHMSTCTNTGIPP